MFLKIKYGYWMWITFILLYVAVWFEKITLVYIFGAVYVWSVSVFSYDEGAKKGREDVENEYHKHIKTS